MAGVCKFHPSPSGIRLCGLCEFIICVAPASLGELSNVESSVMNMQIKKETLSKGEAIFLIEPKVTEIEDVALDTEKKGGASFR